MTKKLSSRAVNTWRVLRYIESMPGCAVLDIMRETGLIRQSIDKCLRRLLELNIIHVSGWQRYDKTDSGFARQFTAGPAPGQVLYKPRVPVAAQVIRHREKARLRMQRVRMLERAKRERGNVFSIVIQQII